MYLLECMDGSLYTGITNKLASRYAQHERGKGARYTRSHPPKCMIGSLVMPNRSQASVLEYRIKQLKPAQKLALFERKTR